MCSVPDNGAFGHLVIGGLLSPYPCAAVGLALGERLVLGVVPTTPNVFCTLALCCAAN